METIRWGIMGCNESVAALGGPPLARTQGSELWAVMCEGEARAVEYARQLGASRTYVEGQELVADRDVNAVYIAGPRERHLEYATLAAQMGKLVLCDAPMGTSAADAQAIVDVCKENRVPLTVAYYRRFWYITRAMRRLLLERAVGEIVQVRVQVSDSSAGAASGSAGGVLVEIGDHWVDLVRLFIGEIGEVMAGCWPERITGEVEETASAVMSAGGALVSLLFTRQSPTSINEIEILGTEGRLWGSPYSEGKWLLQRPYRQPELVEFPHIGPAHTELIADLVPRMLKGESSPVPGEQAVANWKVIQELNRSCEQGTRVRIE